MKRVYIASLALPIIACGTVPVSTDLVGMEYQPDFIAEPVPAEEPVPDPPIEEPPIEEPHVVVPEDPTDLLGCEDPERHWFNEQTNWWVDTGWLGIVGDNQFVVHSQMITRETLFRVSDGRTAGSMFPPVAIEYDDTQTRGIYGTETAFEIREVATQRVLYTVELEDSPWQTYRMELSPDGRTVASAHCSEDGTSLEIRTLELAFGAQQSWTLPTSGMVYCPGWASHNAIPFDVAAGTVITADPSTGGVVLLSTIDGSMRTLEGAHEVQTAETRLWFDQPVLDVAIRADGAEFATSGLDGVMRRWRLEDLSLIDERESSWIVVNMQTYTTPFAVSPLVYSHNSEALAYTATGDRAGLVNLQRGTVDRFVPTASSERPDHMAGEFSNWGVAELGFSRDDRALIVVEAGGTQLYGCELGSPASAALDIDIDVAETTRVGEAWTFDIQINSEHGFVGGQWSLNGVQLAPLYHLNEWSWVFHEPGTQTFRIVLDDGRTVLDETFEIEVVP